MAVIILCALFSAAGFVHAASDTQLSSMIRAQLLSDPRTSSLSSAELNAMVELLTNAAQKEGLSASDIEWHPASGAQAEGTEGATPACEGIPTLSCMFDEAFGFVGPDTTIPFILGVASMGLVWVCAEMLHRRRHPLTTPLPPAPSAGM